MRWPTRFTLSRYSGEHVSQIYWDPVTKNMKLYFLEFIQAQLNRPEVCSKASDLAVRIRRPGKAGSFCFTVAPCAAHHIFYVFRVYYAISVMVWYLPIPPISFRTTSLTPVPVKTPIKNIGKFAPNITKHDDVITWKRFPHYWPFVRGLQRLPAHLTKSQ